MALQNFPYLEHFQFEMAAPDIGHLMLDSPGRKVNVLSASALADLESAVAWIEGSGLEGLVLSSAKVTGFCAGADLTEIEAAYRMIALTPEADRPTILRNHFAAFTRSFRQLETVGLPVAVAIEGPALGGGCELALAGHWRVMADTQQSVLGLPEIGVGLFPAGGGSQRLPRLVGLDAAVPVLFDGKWLSAHQAVANGAADAISAPGQTVAKAVEWLQTRPSAQQAWSRPGRPALPTSDHLAKLRQEQEQVTRGHYPAITAMLDCLERGLAVDMDHANAIELEALVRLLLRPEPKVMMATLFHGRQAYQRLVNAGNTPTWLASLMNDVGQALGAEAERLGRERADADARKAGFTQPLPSASRPVEVSPANLPPTPVQRTGLWIDGPWSGWMTGAGRLLAVMVAAASHYRQDLSEVDRQIADYAVVSSLGFPAYLGGPFGLLEMAGGAWVGKQIEGHQGRR